MHEKGLTDFLDYNIYLTRGWDKGVVSMFYISALVLFSKFVIVPLGTASFAHWPAFWKCENVLNKTQCSEKYINNGNQGGTQQACTKLNVQLNGQYLEYL